MTSELEKRFAEVGKQEGKGFDALVIAKYFDAGGSGTWYATEYNPESRSFFGYVTGLFEDEWGYFSLDELQSVKGSFGLGIERDLHIGERTLGDILGHTKEPEEAGMGRLREEP
jgi:hypothetical protein